MAQQTTHRVIIPWIHSSSGSTVYKKSHLDLGSSWSVKVPYCAVLSLQFCEL